MVAPPVRRPPGKTPLLNVTESRSAAAQIMADLREGRLLDQAFENRTSGLDPRDRRWTRELVSGTLRERGRIDTWVGSRAHGGIARLDVDLIDLIRLGAYQLLFMDSVPPYAAIGQTVELVKDRHGIGAGKLANALLRRIDRERSALDDEIEGLRPNVTAWLSARYSHPEWLVARYVERWGAEATGELLAANNREAYPALRPWGIDTAALRQSLQEAGIPYESCALDDDSVLLTGSTAIPTLPGFAAGHFFVQDPAATLVTRYAAVPDQAVVLDLCAAPGGKAVELSRRARRVLAADRSAPRLERVRENLARLHISNIDVVVADALDASFEPMDVVLVDAPCTGTGTFRRHPDARWRLRISDLHVSAALQMDILANAARWTRPGGLLVYSTCSMEPEENDAVVATFLRDFPEFVMEPPPAGAVPEAVLESGLLRVLPHRHAVDGAFGARFRRAGGRS